MASPGSSGVTRAHKTKRLPRAQRIEDIMVAARAYFEADGFDGAAVADIAAAAGVVEGTVYKFFNSKRELLVAVIAGWFETIIDELEGNLRGIETSPARLRFIVWSHLRVIEREPGLCRLFFREIRSREDYENSAIHNLNRRYTTILVQTIRDGVRRGDFVKGSSPSMVRDIVFGGLEHHATGFLYGGAKLNAASAADRLTAMVLAGLSADKGKTS